MDEEVSLQVDAALRWLGSQHRDRIKILCKYIATPNERALFIDTLAKAKPQEGEKTKKERELEGEREEKRGRDKRGLEGGREEKEEKEMREF